MLDWLWQAQSLLSTLLGVGALAMMVWALTDCLRTSPEAFVAAGKRTKQFWSIVTGVATAVGFIFVLNPLNIINIAAVIAAAIYLTDVRPALRSLRGGTDSNQHMGPYGPW